MDTHYRQAPLTGNMPVLAALLGIWNRNFLDARAFALLVYDDRLALLPDWLQQLDMESNGKVFDRHGRQLPYATGPLVFGGTGTNAQHAVFQHLHQGYETVTCDFVCTQTSDHAYQDHHDELLANCLAQQEALALGAPAQGFAGNVSTNAIVLKHLDAYHLGSLLAFYEHKVTTQGFIWDLNSFDQPGVELGKTLVPGMLETLDAATTNPASQSTKAVQGLCKHLKT
jgi:glucose-6-phosphate isomerase